MQDALLHTLNSLMRKITKVVRYKSMEEFIEKNKKTLPKKFIRKLKKSKKIKEN